MLEQFHFLEPQWLLALMPLAIIFWLTFQTHTDSRAWEKIIDAKLLPLLLQGKDNNKNLFARFLMAMVWLIAVIALADPVWEKVPRPIFQTNAARVIVLDLSNSMLIDDVKPSRIARARFKIEDILSREEEGQTGLVLFAGEAFTASPLTRDTETIRSMLKVLTPQIMPAQGSRADLGLVKAHELLKQAGIVNGEILLIADGISQKSASISAARNLLNDGHTVSVMAVGTEQGGTLNFRNNVSKVINLDPESLKDIASSGGGNYHLMTANNTDLKHLLNPIIDNNSLENKLNDEGEDNGLQNREWYSTGPFIVLLLLPFAALAFRRGWLLNVAFAFIGLSLLTQPQELLAAVDETQIQSTNEVNSNWQNLVEVLSKNKAQRANDALLNQQYKKARELSDDPLRRGSAEFRLEDYDSALASYKQAQGADARYNEGNTLAKLKKYEEAIAAYDEALKLNSSMQDALDNKKAIEDFLKRQQQSDDNKQSSNDKQDSDSDSKSDSDSQSADQNQESGDSKDDQQKKDGSQSADKGEEQDKKSSENQFSEANEDLEENKKDAEQEELEASQNEPENKDENGDNKSQAQQNASEGAYGEQGEQESGENQPPSSLEDIVKQTADELTEEEKMAAEQWLRRIPDDPGGLLRRKFRHQYNQSRRNNTSNSSATEQPW